MAQILIFVAYGAFVYSIWFPLSSLLPIYQSFQGQFTLPLAFQGVNKYFLASVWYVYLLYMDVSDYWHVAVGNIVILFTGIIEAGLFGNIGISERLIYCFLFVFAIDRIILEIVYRDFVEDWFKGFQLMTPKGRIIWTGEISKWYLHEFQKTNPHFFLKKNIVLVLVYWAVCMSNSH